MNTSPRRVLPTAFLFLLAAALTARPQDLDNARLSGKILDMDRAAVAGAAISLSTVEAGSDRWTRSDREGRFRFLAVAPGRYLLRISAKGFDDRVTAAFDLRSAAELTVDLILLPETLRAEQTVEAGGAVDTFGEGARPAVGGSIGKDLLMALPNVSSSVLDLALLFGGTAEEAVSTRDLSEDSDSNARVTPLEQGLLSLGGGTAYSNNLTVDGLDNNDDRTSRERFIPPLEAVAELQIVRNQFSAEYGRASGGRINMLTGSGGRRFRGTFGFSGRDERLNANTWFNNSRGLQRPTLRERGASAHLSGPLCSNGCLRQVHFAASSEFQRKGDTTMVDTFLPVVGSSLFRLPFPNGGAVFCEAVDSDACSGDSPSAAYISPYTALLATPNTVGTAHIRIDAKPFGNLEASIGVQFGRKSLRRTSAFSVGRLPEALQSKRSSTEAFNLSLLFHGANRSNQIRFQWSELLPAFIAHGEGAPVLVIAFRNPLTGAPSNLVAANSTASTLQNFAESREEKRLQIQDVATLVSGPNIFKFGGELQSIDSKANALGDSTGTFNFSNMRKFTVGAPSRFRQNFGTLADVRNKYVGIFLNDELRLGDRLNLTFGIRYEVETAVGDRDNLGPRIAIAWDLKGNGGRVLRAGAGVFYNRVLLRTVGDFARMGSSLLEFDTNLIGTHASDPRRISILSAIAGRFPHSFNSVGDLRALIASTVCGAETCAPHLGFSSADSASLPSRRIAPGIRIPESRQLNIGYERKIHSGFAFVADFTVNAARGLWRELDANAPVLPPGFPDWTRYLLANPFIFANSNGTLRTYRFYLGTAADPNVSTQPGGGSSCSTVGNVVCHVNLNSVSAGTTLPSTSTADSTNSIGSPIGIALSAIARFRPDQTADRIDTIASVGRALHKGLVLEFRAGERAIFLGLRTDFRASYTLSSQKDDGLNNTSNAEISGDFGKEWSRSLQDRRHRVTFFGRLRLPKGVSGLDVSPVLRFGSSAPFNIGTGTDRNLDGSTTDRPDFGGAGYPIIWRRSGSEFPETLLSRFSLPSIGARGGTLRRNAGTGPRLFILDLNLSRDLRFSGRLRVRPNLEIGNVLNAAVFSYGAEYIDFTPLGPSPTAAQVAARDRFLVPTRTLRAREMRLGMKLEF